MIRRNSKSVSADNSDLSDSVINEKEKGRKFFIKNSEGKKRFRLLAVILAVIIAVIVFLIVYITVSGSQGMRKSQKLSKKIGETSEKAASYADIELTASSDFDFVNELVPFTSLAESEKTTKVYDVNVPEWTIFCSENSFGKLESVTYCDFRVLKKNINGFHKNNRVDTSAISTGSTLAEVDSVLDMDPYQIVYSENSISRKYKYYYKDKESGRIKAYYVTVMFGKDNKVNSPVIEEANNFIFEILKAENN